MRWALLVIPILTSAQTVTITIPDTLPEWFHRWQDTTWSVTLSVPTPMALRMLPCIEGEHMRLCTPFSKQPVTIIRDAVRMPLSAVLAELLLNTEPFYPSNRLPAGQYRLCIELVDAHDSLRQKVRQCRAFTVVGIPFVALIGPAPRVRLRDSTVLRFAWWTEKPLDTKVRFELRVVERAFGQSAWHALMTAPMVAVCWRESEQRTQWECSIVTSVLMRNRHYVWGVVVEHEGRRELVSPLGEFVTE